MNFIEIPGFIRNFVTNRSQSYFAKDIQDNFSTIKSAVEDRNVLVIGGAGTIGSSFIKALLPFKPASLMVVDYNENGLTELTRDLRSQEIYMPPIYVTYPFDFGSKIFEKLFLSHSFDIVACFAAHKHVRSEKDHFAIEAMIRNNVFNTKKLLDLALQSKPKHLFSVSTDKAANPANVMGATKKIMEHVLMAYSKDLKITTARFANVAFSNGSLLAGFIERIMKRQPLSAPKDVKRYFVSPEESGQLCLLACILGDSGDILFPKLEMSQMKTFSEIAENFLSELNLLPDYCQSEEEAKEKAAQWDQGHKKYPVYFFSTNTSGEKPYEEFFTKSDQVNLAQYQALGVIANSKYFNKTQVDSMIQGLEEIFEREQLDKQSLVDYISIHVPDFHHIETGKSLDDKM